jgi:hypothetical protein
MLETEVSYHACVVYNALYVLAMSRAQLRALEQRLDALVREESGRRLGTFGSFFDKWRERRAVVDAWRKEHKLKEFVSDSMGEMGLENGDGARCVIRYDTDAGGWLIVDMGGKTTACANITDIENVLVDGGFIPVVISGYAGKGKYIDIEAKAGFSAARFQYNMIGSGSYTCISSSDEIRVFFDRYRTEKKARDTIIFSLSEEITASKWNIEVRMCLGVPSPCLVFMHG